MDVKVTKTAQIRAIRALWNVEIAMVNTRSLSVYVLITFLTFGPYENPAILTITPGRSTSKKALRAHGVHAQRPGAYGHGFVFFVLLFFSWARACWRGPLKS